MGQNVSKQYNDFWAYFGLSVNAEFGVVGFGSIARCSLLSFLAYFLPFAALKRSFRDPSILRSAVAFGTFSFVYRSVRLLLARLVPQHLKRVHEEAPAISGAAGALACCLVDPSFVSSVFVFWWCVRAFRTLSLVDKLQQSTMGIPLLYASTAGLLSIASMHSPEDAHVSYIRFLDKMLQCSGKNLSYYRSCPPNVTLLQHLTSHSSISSGFFFLARMFARVLSAAAQVYIPLNLVWAALRLPMPTAPSSIAINVARSSFFLACYGFCSIALLMMHSSLVGGGMPPRLQMVLWTWLPGMSVFIERHNRRAELAFFCLAHALNSVWNRLKRNHLAQPNNAIGIALVMAATGQLMKHNAERPGRTMHLLFGEKLGRPSQALSQKSNTQKPTTQKDI